MSLTVDGRSWDRRKGDLFVWEGLSPNTDYSVHLHAPPAHSQFNITHEFRTQRANWEEITNDFPQPVYALTLDSLIDGAWVQNAARQSSSKFRSLGNAKLFPDVPTPMFGASMRFASGDSLIFGRKGNQIRIPESHFNPSFHNNSMTIEMWLKPLVFADSLGQSWLCAQADDSGQYFGISMVSESDGWGRLMLGFSHQSSPQEQRFFSDDLGVQVNQWQHIAVVCKLAANDHLDVLWYINGQESRHSIGYFSPPLMPEIRSDFVIGSHPIFPNFSANALVAGFKMYDAALTADQIKQSQGNFWNFDFAAHEQGLLAPKAMPLGTKAAPLPAPVVRPGAVVSAIQQFSQIIEIAVSTGLLMFVPAVVPDRPVQPQVRPPGGPSEPIPTPDRPVSVRPPSPTPGIPIDNGLGFLMLGAVVLGARKLRYRLEESFD